MALRVGLPAPLFKSAAVMPDNSFKDVLLADYIGKKNVLLFFYPLDFTFVCPTEIVAFNDAIAQFESRNVQLLACSVDSKYSHLAWKSQPLEKGGIGNVKFPILADVSKEISTLYNVLLPEGISLRGLFYIDKKGVLQHMSVNNLPVGRSVDEALRIVDAFQHHENKGDVCPANWKYGDKGIPPTIEGVITHLTSKLH